MLEAIGTAPKAIPSLNTLGQPSDAWREVYKMRLGVILVQI